MFSSRLFKKGVSVWNRILTDNSEFQMTNNHSILSPIKEELNSTTTAKVTTTEIPFIPIVNATNLSILLNASAVDANSTDSIMLKGE